MPTPARSTPETSAGLLNHDLPIPVSISSKSAELKRRILCEQVKLIYQQGPTLSLGAAAAAVVITYLSTRGNPGWQHVAWLLVVVASVLVRLGLFQKFAKATATGKAIDVDYRLWGVRFAAGSVLAGIVWCAWPILFYADCSTEYLLMISALVAGMIAVLASSGSVYLPAFYCFALPLCLPFIFFHATSGVDVLIWTGWLLLMFFIVNLLLAHKGNRHYAELIEARFRNTDLMDQLAHEKHIAETAVSEKNSFIAAASHDLRQPLHALSLFLAALSKSQLNPRQRSIVSDMQKSSAALSNHFSSILDVSKLESDSIVVSKSTVELDQLVDFLESDFRADAEQKGLYLKLDQDMNGVLVDTDPLILERIIRNIVGNAIRLTDSGGVSLGVTCSDKHAVLSVADTGPGIAPEILPLIFNDYFRGNVSASSGGLGLGLSIVRRFCKLLDIAVDVRSTPGIGAVFDIKIPLHHLQARHNQAVNPGIEIRTGVQHAPSSSLDSLRTGRNVLVIDDEPEILAACEVLLESMGLRAVVALSLCDALTLLTSKQLTPDIVLCDYRLADGANGIETIAALRDWFGLEVPACVVTGDTSPDRLADISASGLPVLYKPVELDQLERRLSELLSESCATTVAGVSATGSNEPQRVQGGVFGNYSSSSRAANATSL